MGCKCLLVVPSLLQIELQFLYSVPEVAIIRANPAQSKSLAVRYGGFVVVWVAAAAAHPYFKYSMDVLKYG